MKFTTQTGTEYEYDEPGQRVRRIGGDPMRRDADWLRLLAPVTIRVGEPAVMLLEPLGDPATTTATWRTTTAVTRIEEE